MAILFFCIFANANHLKTFYNIIVSLRLNDALMYYCGIDDESLLPTIDLEALIRKYMLENGLTEAEIDHLQHVLCD